MPRELLEQHPRALRRAATILLACAALALLAVSAPAGARAADRSKLDRVERKVVKKLNRIRGRAGLPALRRNRALARSADFHSRDMLAADFFAHPSSNGDSMATRVRSYKPARRLGEVLAYVPGGKSRGQAKAVVRMWMRSPGHRASILTRSFRRVGVARRSGRIGRSRVTVFTTDFASAR